MKKRNLIALILALALIFASGCANEKTAEDLPEETTAYVEESTAEISETSASDEEVTEAVAADDEVSTTAVEETTEAEKAAPQTVEEIVEYFNTTANKIKPTAKKVVKNYEKRIIDEDRLVFPESLESTARSMISSFMKDDNDPIVYETREDITNEFIVPDQSYVSKLKPEYVEKATCVDKGNQYVITLELKDQKNPTAGVGVGAVCDVIEANEVAEGASFVEKFETTYSDCKIVATIDKATDRVVHIQYSTPLLLEMRVNFFGTHDVALAVTFVKDFTITY